MQIVLENSPSSDNELNYLGNFIANFMTLNEGEQYKIKDSTPIGFLIDASVGPLPYCFKEYKDVELYINALVVGDSAGTVEGGKSTTNFYNKHKQFIDSYLSKTQIYHDACIFRCLIKVEIISIFL